MSIGGLESVNFKALADRYVSANTSRYYSNYNNKNATSVYNNTQYDTYVSQEGNTCTDGKDDGKIGIFSAIGNIFEGAVKGAVNGIKGMFTDENGNFSIFKTAKTVALGAACIAFPAVGLAACAVGAVSGGAKIVKGVSTALSATTDAEAKDAWEAVGDGGLTLGVSIVGAKASYNGVIKGASMTSKGSAIKVLDKNASLLQKAGALVKDMGRSTKNSWGKVKTATANFREALEIRKAQKTLETTKTADISKMTPDELLKLDEAEMEANSILNSADKSGTAMKIANKMKSFSESSKAARAELKTTRTALSEAQKALRTAQKTGDDIVIENALNNLNAAQEALQAAKSNTSFGKLTSYAKTKLTNTNTAEYLSNNYTKLTEGGLRNIVNNIKANKDSLELSKIFANLSQDARNVINFLKLEKGTYYEAVNKYGYKSVLEALEAFAGTRLADETV